MLALLLKSTACLTAFLAFYKLVLERESIHHFKRFYLVAAIIASFLIPNMVFTEYIEALPSTEMENIPILTDLPTTQAPQNAVQEENFSWRPLLWSIYGLGVLGFGFRFIGHLAQIWSRIRKNPKHKDNFITRVLLKQPMPPHTFFRFIFLNQEQFENKSIPQEVLLHEETHAKQKHSLDILFIELLQVVLWFNPLIYLFKSSIKLNHEFLADSAVIQKNNDHSHYQNTILSYLSHDGHITHQSTGIANAITYSSIKKRFTVMKTKTTKKSFVLKSFLLLPLTALLLFGFSETKTITRTTPVGFTETSLYPENKSIETTDGISTRTIQLAGLILDSETLLPLEKALITDSKGSTLAKTDNNGYYNVEIPVSNSGEIFFNFNVLKEGYLSSTQIQHWGNLQGEISSAIYIGLRQEESSARQLSSLVPNLKNLDYKTIFTNYTEVKKDFVLAQKIEASKKGNQNVFMQIDKGFYILSDSWIRLDSKRDLVLINDETIVPANTLNSIIKRNQIIGMTPLGPGNKANYVIYTTKWDQNEANKTVNPIEIHINKKGNLLFQNKSILLEDLEDELSKINNHLSFEQRKKVIRSIVQVEAKTSKKVISKVDKILTEYGTATINVLGPKQANQQSASREEMKEYNTLAKKYNAMDRNNMTIKKKDVMRLKEIYEKMSQKQRDDAEPFPDFPAPPPAPKSPKAPKATKPVNEANPKNLPVPPAPPAPPKPIEHVKEMAEKGASFTYNGKAISAKEAVEVVQKNQHINIDAREAHGARPVVKLSTDPIVIDN
ncbi:M56 family metallopeptidase [Muricauda ruestringensis]|uniref:M56 family metallopeptidase n=1 Tax=Flagellimonas ruestringensis TaxID=111501 RepID=UPI001CD58ED0|nr:M56 family metallopeptidase [Allomuricauda ruestringensis]MCA0958254.1 M56 family metallopeptidase [Allomuricauda ruestringensis]